MANFTRAKTLPDLRHLLQPKATGAVLTAADAEALRARGAEAVDRLKAFEAKRAARGE